MKKVAWFLAFIMLVGALSVNNSSNNQILAQNIQEYTDNFTENTDEYEYIEEKVDQELKSNIGIMDNEVEDELNKKGVFDEELAQFTDEDIEILEKMDLDEINVSTQFYSIEDTEELSDCPIKEDELIQLSDEEINEYFEEKYSEPEHEKNGTFLGILESIGLKPIEVNAASLSYGGEDDKNNKTMLKKTIICEKKKGTKKYIWTRVSFLWTSMPKYRQLDSISIEWDGAEYDRKYEENTKVVHSWTKHIYEYDYKGKKKLNMYVSESKQMTLNANPALLKSDQYHARAGYMCCAAKLHENSFSHVGADITYYDYYNEQISFSMYLKRKSKRVDFFPYYLHAYTSRKLGSVAIDLLDGGRISAIYKLLSGKTAEIKTNYSGVNKAFTFKF